MSQLTKIEAILRSEGQIDNFYCVNNKLTWRLGARIDDLKKRGWEFDGGYYDERNPKNYVYKVLKTPESVVELPTENEEKPIKTQNTPQGTLQFSY